MLFRLKLIAQRYWYIAVFVLSSVTTMSKLILYADHVEPVHFNSYVIVLSLGSFLGFLISFGIVESTQKTFARLFVVKKIHSTLGSYRHIFPTFFIRGLFLLFGLVIYVLISDQKSLVWAIGLCLLAMTVTMTSLLASMQRSTMKTNLMAGTSLLRASLSMITIFVGYLFSPTYGAIFGEIFAQLVSLLVGFYLLLKSHSVDYRELVSLPIKDISADLKATKNVKFYLFLAYLIMSLPLYLDRFYFELNYPIGELAPYSLCAILLSASYLIYNSLFQRAGPEMIIKTKKGSSAAEILMLGGRAVSLGAFCLSILFSIIFLAYEFGWAADLVNKYKVTPEMILLIFLISLTNGTAIFEGAFLSFDKEREFFSNSVLYLLFLGFSIVGNFIFGLSLIEFLYIYLAVKLLHVVSTITIFWLSTNNKKIPQVVT
jgi:hypothetical protein